MGFRFTKPRFNQLLEYWRKNYSIFAPTLYEGGGVFSDTDMVRYGIVKTSDDIVFDQKSQYSFKEALLPLSQTLFYFTEDMVTPAAHNNNKTLIFLRSCDFHALRRLDEMYLTNGPADIYYKQYRDNAKFVLMGCRESFESCFCADMESNTCEGYDAYIHIEGDVFEMDIHDSLLTEGFLTQPGEEASITPQFVSQTQTRVRIPCGISNSIIASPIWDEYQNRCISCGRCNFACPTCTCFTMQDIAYTDNGRCGERRRVWASCEVDGYTDMAGGHSFRNNKAERMRFRVLHKIHDYKKRNGYHMCVGCGRCDDICPEYISYSACINKIEKAVK